MDTLQQTPPLWYWSEPDSGYSIEDCEQIVAENDSQPGPALRGVFPASTDNSPSTARTLRDAVSAHHYHV